MIHLHPPFFHKSSSIKPVFLMYTILILVNGLNFIMVFVLLGIFLSGLNCWGQEPRHYDTKESLADEDFVITFAFPDLSLSSDWWC